MRATCSGASGFDAGFLQPINGTVLTTDSLPSAEESSSIRIARGTQFCLGNQCADLKVTSHIVSMLGTVPLGTYPSSVQIGKVELQR